MEMSDNSLTLHRIAALISVDVLSNIFIIFFLKHLFFGEEQKHTTQKDFQCTPLFVNPAAKGPDPFCKLLIVSHCSAGL